MRYRAEQDNIVFISSRIVTLKEVRLKLLQEFHDHSGIDLYAYESKTASVLRNPTAFLDKVRECELFVLMYEGPESQATLDELELALCLEKRCLVFLNADSDRSPVDALFAKYNYEPKWSPWREHEELYALVSAAIRDTVALSMRHLSLALKALEHRDIVEEVLATTDIRVDLKCFGYIGIQPGWNSKRAAGTSAYNMAVGFIAENNFAAAKKHFEKALYCWPSLREARAGCAFLYLQNKQYKAALQNLELIEREYDLLEIESIALARLHFHFKNPERAERILQNHLATHPANDRARALYVGSLADQNRNDEALSEAEILLSRSVASPHGFLVRAMVLFKKGSYPQCLEDFKKLPDNFLSTIQIQVMAGIAAFNSLDYEFAAKQFQKALELDSTLLPVRLTLAASLTSLERPKEALQLLSGVVDSAEADVIRGVAYTKTSNYTSAKAAFNRAVDADPGNDIANIGIAHFLTLEEEYDKALPLYRKYISRRVHNDAYTNYGICASRLGLVSEALSAHKKAVALDPKNPTYVYNMACSLSIAGMRNEALGTLKAAIELDPTVKTKAPLDPDFATLHNDRHFVQLTAH
jgi:tetratricopeptide (TPR) repeat protein